MPLSNATQQILNTQYYDDYYATNGAGESRGEEFGFHRVLFRPKFAVQSRELTQLQTILQAQLENLGKGSFKDGDAVFGGQLTLDTSVISGQVGPTTNLVSFFNRTTNQGQFIYDNATPTTKAHVLQFLSADEGQTNNYLVYKLQSAVPFLPGAQVKSTVDDTITATFAAGSDSDVFHNASIVSIDEGIYFVEGFFVHVQAQSLVLNPFSSLPSYRVGLTISEQILDELDPVVGDTLLDPANQNAPGAHRFRIVLTLDKRDLSTSADAGFIELMRVINGQVIQSKKINKYVKVNELNDILARRTFDEAGDYIVKDFTPVIDVDPNDSSNFLLNLGPGKAYVRGYEINSNQSTKIPISKGRATLVANNRSIPAPVGNFVYATRLAATVPLSYFGGNVGTVDLHCVPIGSLDITGATGYRYSRIGQAKVRMVEPFSAPTLPSLFANNTVEKLFIYDVVGDTVTGNVVSASVNNSVAITMVLPVANGTPAVNNAIVGATIVLSGASSPATGTFTVNNYVTANATHVFATLKEFIPTLPNNNTAYRLIFQTKDVDAFALFDGAVTVITSPYTSNLAFQADVHVDSKVGGAPTGNTIVFDTNDNVLLYQIPEKFAKANTISTNTATFKSWLDTTANAQAFGGATNANFTITVSGANFSLPVGSLSATTAAEFLVIFDQTVDANGHGRVLNFEDNPAGTDKCISNVVVTQVGINFNIAFVYHFGAASATTRSLVGLAKSTVTGLAVRQKNLIVANTTAVLSNTTGALLAGQIEFHTLNATSGFAYSMHVPDVFQIRKILFKAANTAFANSDLSTATDVTDLFSLDNGQRDNTYEYANLIVGPTASSIIKPTGRMLVLFDWFESSGQGYASVDSYVTTFNALGGLTYDNVPDYTSVKFNNKVNLRDVLDFRPVRSYTVFLSNTMVFTSADSTSNTTYLTTAGDPYLIPVSDDVWYGSYEYFLSRIDKIGLSFDGTFHVVSGLDATSPRAPQDESGTLLMFQVNVPAYTLVDANGVPTSVLLTTFNHKRYSMQDITKLDDRIGHLEYYTALNSLESITKNTPILDSNQNERFKNGIVVDTFHSAVTADVGRPDYTASLDVPGGELRSAFDNFVMQFAADTANSTGSGVVLVGDMAIPTYNVAPFITQPLATTSESVNPFDVASFYGTVRLSPAVDIWKDTSTLPAQVVDLGGPSQSWIDAIHPSFVNWGEWDSTFNGVQSSEAFQQQFTPPGWTPEDHPPQSMTQLSWNDVTTSTTYSQQGTQFEFNVNTTQASLGNKVVDVSVVHFIRSRDVVFAADGLKPSSNLYAYFDGEDISGLVQQANILTLAEQSAGTVPFYIGQTVYIKKNMTGNVAVASGNSTVTGTGTFFDFELVSGQLVRITQGVNTFDAYVNSITSNTSLRLTINSGLTLATATLATLTPVTVADIAAIITGNTIAYTLKVVRAIRLSDTDSAVPYPLTAGSLRPLKQVLDTPNTTTGAVLIVPSSSRASAAAINVTNAICTSGMVRSYVGGTAALRLDTDIHDASVSTPGTTIYFVSGPGAGTFANVVSYHAANQTAILDNSQLTITPETIYSVGPLVSDGFLDANVVTVSGRAGTIAGVFHLPGAEFAVGTRQFRLTDDANNDPSKSTTTAETSYEASGISYTQQEVSVSSRSLGIIRAGTVSQSFTVQDHTTAGFNVQYVDPLAETFLVDAVAYPQGVFVTSLDLCFSQKPTDDIPVIVELRPVINGYPSSQEIVPCAGPSGRATVSLRPDAVKVSSSPDLTNPQTVTTFTFEAPVHLIPGEFAVIVRSDSDLYRVYVAQLGDSIIGSDAKVAKQPYAGSFFKSQNASAWTESPFEDLMFRLNKAVWSGTPTHPQTGVLIARSVPPTSNLTFDSYEFYPHEVQFGDATRTSYLLDIKPVNPTTGNDVSGQVALRYDVDPNTWSLLTSRSMVQGFGGSAAANNVNGRPYPFVGPSIPAANTIDATITLQTTNPDVAPYVDLQKVNILCIRHLINDMGLDANNVSLVNPGARFLPTLMAGTVAANIGNATIIGTNTIFQTVLQAGDTVAIGGNLEVIVASVTDNTHFEASAVLAVTRTANDFWTYGTLGSNNAVALTIADMYGTGAAGYATVGRDGTITGVVFSANGSAYIDTPTLTVASPSAPGGDFTLTQTQATFGFNSELNPSGGNALTRYITRPVTLADGFDARDIQVMFDAYRPLGSHFYVYYAVLPGDADRTRFQDQSWRLMTQDTPDNVISTGYHQFKQFSFRTPNDRALDGSSDTSDKFKVFAIKIVITSSGTVDVPRIANFRAIALDE